MSVLIKDMEMPKNCDECWFISKTQYISDPNHKGLYIAVCRCKLAPEEEEDPWRDIYEIVNSGKHETWCPLVEVPTPHGRLIDSNALKASVPETRVDIFENCRNCELLDDEQVKQIIDDAPTVIEAEE